MWRKNNIGFTGFNSLYHFFNGGRYKRSVFAVINRTGFEYGGRGRYVAHVQNLAPAKTEPAITNNQALFTVGELSGDSLHTKSATARYDNNCVGLVDIF